MIDEPKHFAIPPWQCPHHWSQMSQALAHLTERQWPRLLPARKLADEIGKKLEAVNNSIDTLCNATCVCCSAICCEKATVWYDFRDLLYLYLFFGYLPAEQIAKREDLSCCNLTPAGCRLHRKQRPFICTWYICPSQVSMWGLMVGSENRNNVLETIREIQNLRRQLENRFIEALW